MGPSFSGLDDTYYEGQLPGSETRSVAHGALSSEGP